MTNLIVLFFIRQSQLLAATHCSHVKAKEITEMIIFWFKAENFRFLAEVHFVHYKASYANLSVAVAGGLAGDKAALAVVGIVMEAGRWGRDSPAITVRNHCDKKKCCTDILSF
jgi:hypothetical protein